MPIPGLLLKYLVRTMLRSPSRMISVKSLANFVSAAEGGEEAAAAGADYFFLFDTMFLSELTFYRPV